MSALNPHRRGSAKNNHGAPNRRYPRNKPSSSAASAAGGRAAGAAAASNATAEARGKAKQDKETIQGRKFMLRVMSMMKEAGTPHDEVCEMPVLLGK